ncbi:hypothetical protein ACI2KG_28485 [Pseudomonas sp. NPDC089407]|uniref:hypothetical protein n=1 Tax=Pseudomonas sp. NPDC089407 TaxID=3364464 RepID=UPI00384B47CD
MNLDEKLAVEGIVGISRAIKGDGFLEESAVVNGNLNARFFVGAYSLIDSGAFAKNAFIGRFSTIEKGVQLGYPVIKEKNFSNHFFARNLPLQGSDDYYKKIKTSRYYFEQNRYTFIGSDVLICRGAVVQEGVVVGDGAIVQPNSYVVEDIPPYAIVSGNPAKVIGYRFDEQTVAKLLHSEWWMYDISSLVSKYRANAIDYHDNAQFIDDVAAGNLPRLIKKIFYLNTDRGVFEENSARNMIVGPSHIERWYLFSQKGVVNKPDGYHLLPIPALSIFSAQLNKLVKWWSAWFENVLIFVPDFRIGNVAVDHPVKDGRLVKPEAVSEDNSQKCYALALDALSQYASMSNVRLWFWCLNGREEFNKSNGQYLDDRGNYRHPIWNYEDMLEMYGASTIDIRQYFEGVLDLIVDGSIHPTNECYGQMAKVFDSLDW